MRCSLTFTSPDAVICVTSEEKLNPGYLSKEAKTLELLPRSHYTFLFFLETTIETARKIYLST